MELGAVRGFGLAPGTGPSAGLTSLQSTYILLSCTPPLALPAQARLWWCHCPGQLSLDNSTHGGRRSRKLEMSLQIICASFWGGGGIFFFFFLSFLKTLSSHSYPSAHPLLPTLQSFIAIFFKTRRGCSPGSSEQGIVKSHNLSWMIL